MGNEQSAPAPRRPPNKLSKPKTNNNSSSNLLNITRSTPPSRRNSVSTNNDASARNGDSKLWDEALGEVVEKQKGRGTQKKRLSLFRPRSEKTKPSKAEPDLSIEKDLLEPSHGRLPSYRWSRPLKRKPLVVETFGERPYYEPASEIKSPNHSRVSLQQPTFPQQQTRLSLVTELPSTKPETREGAKGLSKHDQEENNSQASNMGSRRGSDADMYVPIRRRSFLQHGVATRTAAFAQNDPRQSLPSQRQASQERQNYCYYQPEKRTSSPQRELVILGPNSAFAVPGPRTETPTELDYRHTGAFKLGSLRITNGAASPTPSRDGRASSLGAEDEYANARKSMESNHRLTQRSNTLSSPGEARKAPWIVRSESPLRQAHEYKPLSIDIPNPSLALFDFNSTKQLLKSTQSPTKSLELAQEYQQEIALSPFSFDNSPLPSPKLESTSKHTAIEDDLFAPEASTPNMDTTPRMPRSFDSGYEGGPMKKGKGPREQTPKPLAKADSGYSSNVSLRSFKKESAPAVPAKVSRVPSSTYSVNSSISSEATIRRERSLPALPFEQFPPSEPFREAPAVPLKAFPYDAYAKLPSPPVPRKSTEQTSAALKAKPQPHLQVPSKTSRGKSLPAVANITREMREGSPANSETSTSSSTSSSRWPRKKPNKRPQSLQSTPEPVYTVQAFRSPSEQLRIPVPSVEARQHLEQRVDAFPVASFPNTLARTAQLRRTASKETLGTIFSVGSLEVRAELNFARLQGALPPIPTQATIPESPNQTSTPRPDDNKRHTFQAPAPAPAPATRQEEPRRSFQQPVSRSYDPPPAIAKRQSQPDFETHVTSVENISSSLGKSPYEAALAIPKQTKPVATERAKSMTAQFEADTAARFAKARTVSQESRTSTIVRPRKSYDSITNGNPFNGESNNGSRVSSREFRGPPQAHANGRRPYLFQHSQSSESVLIHGQKGFNYGNEEFRVEGDSQQHSTISRLPKPKAPPPVSMSTQHKLLQTAVGSHQTVPPDRTQLQSPAHFTTQQQVQDDPITDGWKKSAGVWAERRKSAAESLLARRSMEMSRPGSSHSAASHSRTQPQPRELKERKSMDVNYYGQRLSTPDSARPSGEYVRPTILHGRKSFDTSQRGQGKTWNVGVGYENSNSYNQQYQYQHQPFQPEEYNHTYGSTEFSHYNKENASWANQYPEQEYYEQEPEFEQHEAQHLPEAIHQRKTSTSEMLVLDRFSGGLGYGYEPGLALVGSAGPRNTGKMGGAGRKSVGTMQYGVDLSDVPVFLQRVKVEG